MAHEVNEFCQTFLSIPVMHKIQVIGEEYMGKDWRTITFRRDHSIQLKKYLIVYSFAREQTFQENANMQFVMNAMRNIQKPRRDQEVVFRVKGS